MKLCLIVAMGKAMESLLRCGWGKSVLDMEGRVRV